MRLKDSFVGTSNHVTESIQESHRVNISRNAKNFMTADPSHDEKS